MAWICPAASRSATGAAREIAGFAGTTMCETVASSDFTATATLSPERIWSTAIRAAVCSSSASMREVWVTRKKGIDSRNVFSFDLIEIEHRSRHGKRKGRSTRVGSALFLIPDDIESRGCCRRQDIIETGSVAQILLIVSDFKSRLLQPTDRCRRPPDHSKVEAR